jgi:MFS family permease
VKERPEDLGQVVDGVEENEAEAPARAENSLATSYAWTPAEAMKTPVYWVIVIGGIASQFPYFFFIAHGILHMKQSGLSAATAAWVMGLFTLGIIVGKQVGGWLTDKMAMRSAFIAGLSCYFVCLALELRITSTIVAVAAGILYGIAFGWTFVCMNTAPAQYFGPAAYAKLNGVNLLVTGLLSSPAGYLGGKLFDLYGSYARAFELNMLVAAAGIAALAFAKMPQRKTVPARASLAAP